ncbi:hypothetical protein SAMN05421823_106176 [Catalinimonas alkaloidigena]|uniref:Uncharacterized protein n=1 Tax=Catalinimonas alkaloidigena TaxID=1075417 RepID=A0A1G9KIQ4_9BACT|nr:hypothetical protein [Catalinimonas alkaloidigena]SDL49668.1 hypothetical protein SAMN05421823_106176 [Catalinimonas alkaloidigena]
MKYRLLTVALLSSALLSQACQSQSDYASDETGFAESPYETEISPNEPSNENAMYTSTPQPSTPTNGGRVVVMDRGLQMPSGSYVLPQGWQLDQDVATSPQTGQPMRYKMDFWGPKGELVRSLGLGKYMQMMGQNVEQSWQQLIQQKLQGPDVQVVSLGPARRSADQHVPDLIRKTLQGYRIEIYERDVRVNLKGNTSDGLIKMIHAATSPEFGIFFSTAFLAPQGRLQEALSLEKALEQSYQPNPQYQQVMAQINQRVMQQNNASHQQWMQQSQAAHQQRMAMRQQAFDAHQQRMASQQQTFDQQNQQWMNNFRNSGTSAYGTTSGSYDNYTSNDYFNDAMRETTSFNDPSSGYRVQQDGQYDYWYTNGQGDYYGTNDVNFNPSTLQGDWQQAQPLTPGSDGY